MLGLLSITDDHETVVLQPSKPAALLAALLLHANTVVPGEFLQQVVWGDAMPSTARSALHTCVLRLRRLFAKYGVDGNAIEAVPGGYRISADADTLDLIRFRELLRSGYAAPDPDAELRLLRSALALWQRPVLGNVHSEILHRDEVPRITEEWLRAVERVFDLELARGRCREVLAELWSVARAHPVHERFWEQLVEALYRAGRRAEALTEYRTVKDYLRTELGVDPGPALQRIELAVLRGQDVRTAPGDRPGDRPAGPSEPATGGAPAEPAWPGRPHQDPHPTAGGDTGTDAGAATTATVPAHPAPPTADRPEAHRRPDAAAATDQDTGTAGHPADPAALDAAADRPETPERHGAAASADPRQAGVAGARTTWQDGPVRPGVPDLAEPVDGGLILDALVDAGLLEESQDGRYQMHELLQVFTRAAAGRRRALTARGAEPERPTDDGVPHHVPTSRHDAAPLRPTGV